MKKKKLEKILNKYFQLYGSLCYFNGYDKIRELPDNPFMKDLLNEILNQKNQNDKS